MMTKMLLIITLVGGCSLSLYAVTEGEMFPQVEISRSASETIATKTLNDKVVVINFWATWCAACKVELKEMQKEFGALTSNPNFQIMFVSVDKEADKATAWVKENLPGDSNFEKFLYFDSEFKLAETLGVDSFPMTIVLERGGKVKKVLRGFKEGEGSTKALAVLAKQLME